MLPANACAVGFPEKSSETSRFPHFIMTRSSNVKHLSLIAICGFFCTSVSQAAPRSFTNTDGKTVEAELVGMEDGAAVLKLGSGSIAKVALSTLSAEDQTFVKAWWEVNKDKLDRMDVRLSISKSTDRIERKVSKPKGNTGQKGQNQTSPIVTKLTKDEFSYTGTLKSYVKKDVTDIEVDYTIYKRVSTRDKNGASTDIEEIDGSTTIKRLEANGSATFETESVATEDFSQTGGKGPRISKRETVLGVVVTLSAGGKDFLTQSYPDNFMDRIEEEEKRQEGRD